MKKILLLFTLVLLLLAIVNASIDPAIEYRFNKGEKSVKVIIEKESNKPMPLSPLSFTKKKSNHKEKIITEVTKKELEVLSKDPKITDIKYAYHIKAFLQESTTIVNSTNSNNLQVQGINLTGIYGQSICIIDSGVNFSHPDLLGKNKTCVIDCYGKACTQNCSVDDDNGHGTHVAGIAAASSEITGIAPNTKLIGVKILNSSGEGHPTNSGNDLTNSIDWCTDNSETYNITVISMSLGTTPQFDTNCDNEPGLADWKTAVDAAYNKNISIVIATGNDANTTHISAPACFSNATQVANTYDASFGPVSWGSPTVCTDSSTALDQIVCHANRNSLVKLLAPGSQINSTKSDGTYEIRGGTSMATPMVAGAIALIKQFLNLTNQYKTPSQIETTLFNTGKLISDSASDKNYSRINIFDAIISYDTTLPNVTLISPENNSISSATNQTFTINITDLQLKNSTFYLWNSTSTVNQTSNNQTGASAQYQINISNLSLGETYYWTLQSYDRNNNTFTANNFTITIGQTSTTSNSPSNNSFTSQNITNFTCTSQTISGTNLSNITFSIFNTTTLLYNTTTNISGVENTTIFNYTLPTKTNYTWNCQTLNNLSNSSTSNNRTLVYETTNPSLTITESPTDATSNSIEKIFYFNASDNYENTNCSLLFDDVIQTSKIITNYTITNNFTRTLTPATYNWKINCTDQAGNSNTSSEASFTITAEPVVTTGSGGGGGGGIPTPQNGTIDNPISSSRLKVGYTDSYKKNQTIYFTVRVENHSLTLNSITNKTINITIRSEPITLLMQENTNKKLNLTTPEYLDLLIEIGNTTPTTAQITIKEIHEKNPNYIKEIDKRIKAFDNQTAPQTTMPQKIKKSLTIIITSVIIIIILIIILTYFILKKRKPKTNKNQDPPETPKKQTNKKTKNLKTK